jgi:hypothetical protein
LLGKPSQWPREGCRCLRLCRMRLAVIRSWRREVRFTILIRFRVQGGRSDWRDGNIKPPICTCLSLAISTNAPRRPYVHRYRPAMQQGTERVSTRIQRNMAPSSGLQHDLLQLWIWSPGTMEIDGERTLWPDRPLLGSRHSEWPEDELPAPKPATENQWAAEGASCSFRLFTNS